MQQRRPRLGDILDDYCPRERRITNHAVVAMIDDQVKQTRCTTCDADHEYKQAKVPLARRKKADGALADSPEGALRTKPADDAAPLDVNDEPEPDVVPAEPLEADAAPVAETTEPEQEPMAAGSEDDGPVHRRLIRATLPRPEGQVPERKAPDFTIRQPGGRGGGGRGEFDGNNNGHRQGGRRPGMRAPGGAGPGQPPRFGGQRPGPGSGQGQGGPRHSGQGQRPAGNRPGQPGGPRGGGRPGPGGQGQGRPGGAGRKRGR